MLIVSGAGGLDTDYVVHINDGNAEVKPIVLRLLPGEETIFELRIVNHGDPSNISVDTSPPLIKAMRLKRSNHFVKKEEVVPVLARMPDNSERVDGELIVTGESGTSRLPISLVREDEDFEKEEGDDEEEGEATPFKINDNYGAHEDEDEDDVLEEERLSESDADLHEAGDYQSYGTLPHKRRFSDDDIVSDGREHRDYAQRANREKPRSWSDPLGSDDIGNIDHSPHYVVEKEAHYYSGDQDHSSGQESIYPGNPSQENTFEDTSEDASEDEEEKKDGLFGLDISAGKIVPIIMLVLIIAVLALTFYTSIIPEFLGALTSSILIVTLIIYGAATLLKA